MSIMSKRIKYRRTQADGTIRVMEEHIDNFGKKHYVGPYLVNTDADADAILLVRDLNHSLVAGQIAALISWVADRNTVATFDFTGLDITEAEGEEEVTKHFARSDGDEALKYAWWIESLNPSTWSGIASRLGWSTSADEIGDRVQTRAQNMVVAENDINRIEDV